MTTATAIGIVATLYLGTHALNWVNRERVERPLDYAHLPMVLLPEHNHPDPTPRVAHEKFYQTTDEGLRVPKVGDRHPRWPLLAIWSVSQDFDDPLKPYFLSYAPAT